MNGGNSPTLVGYVENGMNREVDILQEALASESDDKGSKEDHEWK